MLKLKESATFKAKVALPVPGVEGGEPVEFEFRHMSRTQFDAWRVEGATADAEGLAKVVVGWDGAAMGKTLSRVAEVEGAFKFSKEALGDVLDVIPGAGFAIGRDFAAALLTGRSGN